jgi:hypothetical protein
VNPYAMLAQAGDEAQRRFLDKLQRWHDDMVMHQRFVRRLGPAACSDDCPHAEGRRLWGEAKELLGPAADRLTFLRDCAGDPPKAKPSARAAHRATA